MIDSFRSDVPDSAVAARFVSAFVFIGRTAAFVRCATLAASVALASLVHASRTTALRFGATAVALFFVLVAPVRSRALLGDDFTAPLALVGVQILRDFLVAVVAFDGFRLGACLDEFKFMPCARRMLFGFRVSTEANAGSFACVPVAVAVFVFDELAALAPAEAGIRNKSVVFVGCAHTVRRNLRDDSRHALAVAVPANAWARAFCRLVIRVAIAVAIPA